MSSYASVADFFRLGGLPPEAVQNLSNAQLQGMLDGTSTTFDSYLRSRYNPAAGPGVQVLATWDDDLRRAICHVTAADIMEFRGFNPEAGADNIYEARRDRAMKWLADVQQQRIHPNVTPTQGAVAGTVFPTVNTQCERGWGGRRAG